MAIPASFNPHPTRRMGAIISQARWRSMSGLAGDGRAAMAGGKRYAAVEYDSHAIEQMRERKIAAAQVERAIVNPTRLVPSARFPDRLVAEYDTAMGNTLRVVFVEQPRVVGTVA